MSSIEQRLAEFLAEEDPKLDWVRRAARTHGFLPLYLGWVAVLGILPPYALTNAYLQRVALCRGMKKYPELRDLLPNCPHDARDCEPCAGTGTLAGLPHAICTCGGVGWIIPGEDRGAPY